MRIRDWSSDVCSSDLAAPSPRPGARCRVRRAIQGGDYLMADHATIRALITEIAATHGVALSPDDPLFILQTLNRMEARRVGKECGSKCRSRWLTSHYTTETANSMTSQHTLPN